MNFHYVCEFEPPQTPRSHHRSIPNGHTAVLAADLQNTTSSASFTFSSVRCPDRHWTQLFLACDLDSDCWAKADAVPGASAEASSSWCDTSTTSEERFFLCSSGTGRLPFTLVCDFRKDCFDGSDEDFCVHPECTAERPIPCGSSGQVILDSCR